MWARIFEGAVSETTDIDPDGRFHPSIEWFPVSEDVKVGMRYFNGELVEPSQIPIPEERLVEIERHWRDLEIIRADNEIRKHEDQDPNIIASISGWRTYRVSLRGWPQSEFFPNPSERPKSPEASEIQ